MVDIENTLTPEDRIPELFELLNDRECEFDHGSHDSIYCSRDPKIVKGELGTQCFCICSNAIDWNLERGRKIHVYAS